MSARIVVTGNVATAPDHKITGTGRSRTIFRIGSTDRRLDRQTGEWMDGDSFFVGVVCWGALADNVLTSVKLGFPVVVTGRIAQRTYTDKDDRVQFTYEVTAETVAPDLNRGSAVFTKANRVHGPNLGLDGSGLPAMGVSEDDPRTPVRGEHTVLPDGRFLGASGDVLEAPPMDDDPSESEDADLVGARG